MMGDVLGWRRKFGVMAPSTNTIVQPDFDDMRPVGVTNHYSRIFTPNTNALSNDTFRAGIDTIGSNVMDAIKSVMTCEPDYLVMGISALSFFGGVKGADAFAKRNRGGDKRFAQFSGRLVMEALTPQRRFSQ